MTHFGTSASYIASCMKGGVEPARGPRPVARCGRSGRPARRCRPRASGGSTTSSARDTWLFSTSGGTDVCSAFVGGVPTLPVYQGELQARSLGAKVEAFDEDGKPVIDEVGELVLTAPLPSMPVSFWNDAGRRAPARGLLRHVPGRLAPRGLDPHHAARDGDHLRALGLDDQPRRHADGDGRDLPRGARSRRGRRRARGRHTAEGAENWMPLFVVLREGASLDDDLVAEIRRRVREDCSPRHVPNDVFAVDEVPRTLSGKLLEVPVKRILRAPTRRRRRAATRSPTRRRSTGSSSWPRSVKTKSVLDVRDGDAPAPTRSRPTPRGRRPAAGRAGGGPRGARRRCTPRAPARRRVRRWSGGRRPRERAMIPRSPVALATSRGRRARSLGCRTWTRPTSPSPGSLGRPS